MSINEIIAANLQRLREERNLSFGQLAERSGVSKVMLSQIDKLIALCKMRTYIVGISAALFFLEPAIVNLIYNIREKFFYDYLDIICGIIIQNI